MPINSYKLDGTLTIGTPGLDVSCQVTSVTVEPTENVTTEDAIHVLCGDTLPAEDTVDIRFRLKGNLLQDLAASGVVDYTWTHSMEEVPFVFVPNTTLARQVSGTTRVVPLVIGGDVGPRPASDFDWAVIGTPTFGAVAA